MTRRSELKSSPQSPSADAERNPSLRAAGKARSRLSLLQAAKALFVERGYEGATMRQIASAAGLSTGAVFASFSDKADLFNAVLLADAEEQARRMEAVANASGPIEQRLRRVLSVAYDFQLGQLELLRGAVALSWSQGLAGKLGDRPVRQVVVAQISAIACDAVERGELKPQTDVSLVADTLWDCYVANYRCAIFAGFDAEHLSLRIGDQIDLLLAGQRAGPGAG